MGIFRLIFALFSPSRKKTTRYTARRPSDQAPPHVRAAVQVTRRTLSVTVIEALTELTGRAWVIDGDTIDIGGKRIRLCGIDAPELDHPYGKNAKSALIRLCQGQTVRAVFAGSLSHDRNVATCFLPDGRDLSAEMVKLGMAIDWTKFSGGKYRGFEVDGIRRKLWRCDARQKGRLRPTGGGQG